MPVQQVVCKSTRRQLCDRYSKQYATSRKIMPCHKPESIDELLPDESTVNVMYRESFLSEKALIGREIFLSRIFHPKVDR